MAYQTTAERFVDEMNARRVIRERALDYQYGDAMLIALELTHEEILNRNAIGATWEPGEERVHFVDGSIAAAAPGSRWEVIEQ